MTSSPSSVVIVGGGVLGLHLASRLTARGAQVRVIEASSGIGGLATGHTIGELTWDRFYHVVLESDSRTRELVEEAGCTPALHWSTTQTGFFVDGQFYSLNNSLDFLRFPPLSLFGKGRLAWTILHSAGIKDLTTLERELVEPWLRRHSGHATFERLWRPLLRAKLGERYRETSAAFIGATIARMYAARRAGLKQERFGWLAGGWSPVLDQLRRRLAEQGVCFQVGAPVASVQHHDEGVHTVLASGERVISDAVVLTTSCRYIESLCPQLNASERERLRRVDYLGVVCLSVELDAPLSPYYVTNITDDTIPFTAVIEMSALASAQALAGRGLVYLPQYLSATDAALSEPDAVIAERFLAGLERMYPGSRARVRAWKVARARDVFALPTLNYSRDALPPVTTSIPGVFIANSAQIGAGTLNVNETLAVAGLAEHALHRAGVI